MLAALIMILILILIARGRARARQLAVVLQHDARLREKGGRGNAFAQVLRAQLRAVGEGLLDLQPRSRLGVPEAEVCSHSSLDPRVVHSHSTQALRARELTLQERVLL